MDLVSGHQDGYIRRKNNFLLYHAPRMDQWSMVPWGQDQAFRDGGRLRGGYAGRLAQLCGRAADCQQRIDAAVRYVVDVWDAWDLHGYAVSAAETVADACARDPRKEQPCRVDGVLELLEERSEEVRAELDAAE